MIRIIFALLFFSTYTNATDMAFDEHDVENEIKNFKKNRISSHDEMVTIESKCKLLGDGHTRFVSYLEPLTATYMGSCFCSPTGNSLPTYIFTHSKDDETLKNKIHELCQETAHKRSSPHESASYSFGKIFSHYFHKLPKDITPTRDVQQTNAARTVKIVGTQKGKHGSQLFVFRQKWGVQKWEDYGDPVGQQGNPRDAFNALGPVVGPFFGFKKIDEITYTIPSLEEFEKARAQINQGEPLVLGHGFNVSGQLLDLDGYLNAFTKDYGLPISSVLESGDQTYLFHDVGLHLSGLVVTPPRLMKRLKSIVEIDANFQNYLRAEKPLLWKSSHTTEFATALKELLATFLDAASVQAMVIRAMERAYPREAPMSELQSPFLAALLSPRSQFLHRNLFLFSAFKANLYPIDTKLWDAFLAFMEHQKDPDFDELQAYFKSHSVKLNSPGEQAYFLVEEHMKKLEAKIKSL